MVVLVVRTLFVPIAYVVILGYFVKVNCKSLFLLGRLCRNGANWHEFLTFIRVRGKNEMVIHHAIKNNFLQVLEPVRAKSVVVTGPAWGIFYGGLA